MRTIHNTTGDSCTPRQLATEQSVIWGAFLLEGVLIQPPLTNRIHAIIDHWPSGFIELVTEACGSLGAVWEQVRDCWHHPEMFDGVFEYEVISPLGQCLGDHLLEHGCLPSPDHIQGVIAELVESFFCMAPACTAASSATGSSTGLATSESSAYPPSTPQPRS